jgi:O-antigen ligase
MGVEAVAVGAALAGGALVACGLGGLAVGAAGAAAVWAWPGLGVAVFLASVAGLVPPDLLPEIRLPWGGLESADLLLLVLLARAVYREKSDRLRGGGDMEGPTLVFLGLSVVSLAQAILVRGTAPLSALSEMRPLSYLALGVVVSRLGTSRGWLKRSGTALVVLASAVALLALLQHLRGVGVPGMGGRVRFLETVGGLGVVRVARVQAAGTPFVFLAFFYSIARVALGTAGRPLWLGLCGLMGLQMVLTFSRNLWVSAVVGAVVVIACLPGRVLRTAVVLLAAVAALGLSAAALRRATATEYLSLDRVVKERFASLFQASTLQSSQVQGRLEEVRRVWPVITPNWIHGVGLGTPYLESPIWNQGETLSYIHNGYLAILLKTGAVGLAALLLVLTAVGKAALEARAGAHAAWGAALSGFVVVLLVSSLAAPRFVEPEWMAALGVGVGVIAISRRQDDRACT